MGRIDPRVASFLYLPYLAGPGRLLLSKTRRVQEIKKQASSQVERSAFAGKDTGKTSQVEPQNLEFTTSGP